MRLTGGNIQGLSKENVVQMAKMNRMSTKLKEIEQNLNTYRVVRTENLINIQPDISIKFDCSPVEMKVDEVRQIHPQMLPPKENTLNTVRQPSATQTYINQLGNDHHQEADDSSSNYEDISDDDHTDLDNRRINTSYNIDRMASDGENILYTSYYEEEPDRIAYRYMYDNDDDDEDEYQEWNQSRIEDMIWWDRIKKFVCATNNGIYTVENGRRRFKIRSVICVDWSYVRVSANTEWLFAWMNCRETDFYGIKVYSAKFKCKRTIHFDTIQIGNFVSENIGFCVTNNLIASIGIPEKKNHRVFRVTFCDLDMKKLFSVPLGPCKDNIEIRTDGNNRFFITTGRRRFYIVSSDDDKQIINLQNEGNCIVVFNDHRVAVSGGGNSMEIITY